MPQGIVYQKQMDIESNPKELESQKQRSTIAQRRMERLQKLGLQKDAKYATKQTDQHADEQQLVKLVMDFVPRTTDKPDIKWKKLDVEVNLKELEERKHHPSISQRRLAKLEKEAYAECEWQTLQEVEAARAAQRICNELKRAIVTAKLIPYLEAAVPTGHNGEPFWAKFDRLHHDRYHRQYHLNPLARLLDREFRGRSNYTGRLFHLSSSITRLIQPIRAHCRSGPNEWLTNMRVAAIVEIALEDSRLDISIKCNRPKDHNENWTYHELEFRLMSLECQLMLLADALGR